MKRYVGVIVWVMVMLSFHSCKKLVSSAVDCSLAPFGADFDWQVTNNGVAPVRVDFRYVSNTKSGLSYSWEFGDGTTGAGETVTHIYQQLDNYRVTLSVIGIVDDETCIKTIHKDLDLNP